MKTTTTYLIGCTWCDATGTKFPMHNTGTSFSSICPVCNGAKTVVVTEVTESEAQPSDEWQKLMNDIAKWSDATFGEGQRNPAIVYHLKKEVDELIQTFEEGVITQKEIDTLKMEFADCMMLLLDSASHAFFTSNDLLQAVKEKLEINKQRTWGKPDKNGVVEHIKIGHSDNQEAKNVYYCSICHKNIVDAENGFDTCQECLNKM